MNSSTPIASMVGPKYLHDLAFSTLEPVAANLFQLRKVGVAVHVPRAVREAMLRDHGNAAARILELLDGQVVL